MIELPTWPSLQTWYFGKSVPHNTETVTVKLPAMELPSFDIPMWNHTVDARLESFQSFGSPLDTVRPIHRAKLKIQI